jgi:hypothetical protein
LKHNIEELKWNEGYVNGPIYAKEVLNENGQTSSSSLVTVREGYPLKSPKSQKITEK